MFGDSDYFRTVSLKLSEVLGDIGVSERMVLKRRRVMLLEEAMHAILYRLLGWPCTHYSFGSRSEGSTTRGLNSDYDTLQCFSTLNMIQDWSEWQLGMMNLLMIRDETISPGYCNLQVLCPDEPRPFPFFPQLGSIFKQSDGKVLFKNTVLKTVGLQAELVIPDPTVTVQGPALTLQSQLDSDVDCVIAVCCKSWPAEAQAWLVRQGAGEWPTEEMKRYCETTGCFAVPVSSKSGQNEELEWRISTSLAERCLMFSLNITQMRCYILLKMILKTFVNPRCNGVLSSFMCKTALFHCIQIKRSNIWHHSNLLPCLIHCLTVLQNFVRQRNCPHFIIPENNLMAGKISSLNKYRIIEILQNIIESKGRSLLEIPIDDFGARLQVKMNIDGAFQNYDTPAQMYALISSESHINSARDTSVLNKLILNSIIHGRHESINERLSDFIFTIMRTYTEIKFNKLKIFVLKRLLRPFFSSLGSLVASSNIYTDKVISREALACFCIGLNSDVSSGRLKFASALYCVGDMNRTELVLRNTVGLYDLNIVEPICGCYGFPIAPRRPGFIAESDTGNEELVRHITAFCVRFTQSEIHCVPQELQYEMFRSTQEDMIERNEFLDIWMDWAAVDSLPYLYFLQYKTYGHLQRAADQQRALVNLVACLKTEQNLGHRETALNLLGQCMEQENRHTDALHCYMISRNVRARNNAANFLLCRLLRKLAYRRVV